MKNALIIQRQFKNHNFYKLYTFQKPITVQQYHPKQHSEILVGKISYKKYNKTSYCLKPDEGIYLAKEKQLHILAVGTSISWQIFHFSKQWKKSFGTSFPGQLHRNQISLKFFVLPSLSLMLPHHCFYFYPKMSVMVQYLVKSNMISITKFRL